MVAKMGHARLATRLGLLCCPGRISVAWARPACPRFAWYCCVFLGRQAESPAPNDTLVLGAADC